MFETGKMGCKTMHPSDQQYIKLLLRRTLKNSSNLMDLKRAKEMCEPHAPKFVTFFVWIW